MPGTAQSGGNRAKTRRQHEIDGTYRKDRHADLQNPEPTPGEPEKPPSLQGLAADEWHRLMWAFGDMGMLHKVDVVALEQYCKLYAETEEAATSRSEARAALQILEENLGDVDKSDKVQLFTQIVKLHEAVLKYTDKTRQGRMAIRQYLVEFGLTPSSRSRVKLPSRPAEVDEFTAFQQGRVT